MTSEWPITVKKLRVVTTFFMRPVVTAEHHQCAIIQVQLIEQLHELSEMGIDLSHHPRKRRDRVFGFGIGIPSHFFFELRKLLSKWGKILFGRVHRRMRDGHRKK